MRPLPSLVVLALLLAFAALFLGGDRPVETEAHREILRAMARGLQKGDGGSVWQMWAPPRNEGERSFMPPDPGEALDWVLVLDDAAQGYPPPGETKRS
jgi:hypothetical protein